jgi:hypothetical protein
LAQNFVFLPDNGRSSFCQFWAKDNIAVEGITGDL